MDESDPIIELANFFLNPDPLARKARLPVELTSTEPHFGGRRYWFTCPVETQEGWACGRRVQKLWLLPNQVFFGCSQCYDLTHKSSLECHTFDKLAKEIGARAPDEEKGKLLAERGFKAWVTWVKIEHRRSREREKSLMDIFEDIFGEG